MARSSYIAASSHRSIDTYMTGRSGKRVRPLLGVQNYKGHGILARGDRCENRALAKLKPHGDTPYSFSSRTGEKNSTYEGGEKSFETATNEFGSWAMGNHLVASTNPFNCRHLGYR